jgi:hypothetical protein
LLFRNAAISLKFIMARKNPKPSKVDVAAAVRASGAEFDRFTALSDSEKTCEAEAAANATHSRALTPAERELWKKAKRSLGRPKRGRGAKPVNITVERGLLERADAYAQRHGLTRSQVVARGLVLAIAG